MVAGRTEWDAVFFSIAHIMSTRSTCNRAAVGCVIVDPRKQIMTSGYNGAPRGMPHCVDVGCLLDAGGSCVRTNHDVTNAIVQAAFTGVSVHFGTVYTTLRPCVRCANLIIQAGIKNVKYLDEYETDSMLDYVRSLFYRAGVEMTKEPRTDEFDWFVRGSRVERVPERNPSQIPLWGH